MRHLEHLLVEFESVMDQVAEYHEDASVLVLHGVDVEDPV